MTNKKLTTACMTALLLSTTFANAADFGLRVGMEKTNHQCKFSNTSDFTTAAIEEDADITSYTIESVQKTKDCDKETKPTIGIFAKNKLPNNLFLETEIAYVSKRDFNSTYTVNARLLREELDPPENELDVLPNNTQKISVKSFPRLLLSLGSDMNMGNFIISPVVGVGYAQIKASGDQNSGQFKMGEKTNDNFIWNVGASFSIPKSSWSIDYRYIDYGNVETQATQHPSADGGREKLHGNMSSHTVSLSYLF